MSKKSFGFIQVRKEFLFSLKFRGVHTAAATAQLHGMLQVQHLVVDDVFHGVAGNPRVVEDAAHDDSIVRRVVMPQPVASVVSAPGHPRPSEQAIKELLVQLFKDIVQIVGSALGTFDPLAPAHLAD